MNLSMFLNPWMISGGIGSAFGLGIVTALVVYRQAVKESLGNLRKQLLTRTAFFWAVNIIFMAVSVLHAGVFFGITGKAHDPAGMAQYLGFAVSFFMDLVTIILMQAMLESRHRGEDDRARQFLFFIAICCLTSTFANLAISLNDFDPQQVLPHAPDWVKVTSPYVLSSFPLFVIMMSIASEMILNIRPMDKLNELTFEVDEKKRIKMLEIRNTYLARQVDLELQMRVIRAKQRATKALGKGQIIGMHRWPWEKSLAIDTVIAGVANQLDGIYATKFTTMSAQNEALIQQLETLGFRWNTAPVVGMKSQDGMVLPSSTMDSSSVSITPDPVTEIPVAVVVGNDTNAMSNVGAAAGVSQPRITDVLADRIDAGIPTSINAIPASVNLASLNLSPEELLVVKRYPGVFSEWLSQDIKSVSIPEIALVTGQSKRRVQYQVGRSLKKTSRNENKILVSSVIDWLRTMPLLEQVGAHTVDQNQGAMVEPLEANVGYSQEYSAEIEIDKLAMTLSALAENPAITDEDLADILGLKRVASAHFWRLKARMVLEQDQEIAEESVGAYALSALGESATNEEFATILKA